MSFHTKHRPRNLKEVIGHEAHVTRLRGLLAKLESGESKSAIMFTGPSSVGKTTLARAFAAEVNGLKDISNHPDYVEKNASSARTMEDVQQWVKESRYMPRKKKRIIVIDEAQGLLGNKPAAAAFLKPLEEPPKNTIWVLCSMDPTKFSTDDNGKAMLNRCTQFALVEPTVEELYKFAKRIAKREDMHYVLDDECTALKAVAKNAGGAMRNVANLVESLQEYYMGIDGKKPKSLTKAHVNDVLQSTITSDDALAATVLLSIYKGKFANVQRGLIDIKDGFSFVNKLMWANYYMLNMRALNGERHNKVYPSATAKLLMEAVRKEDVSVTLGTLAAVHEMLVITKGQAQDFTVTATELLSANIYRAMKNIFTPAILPKAKDDDAEEETKSKSK